MISHKIRRLATLFWDSSQKMKAFHECVKTWLFFVRLHGIHGKKQKMSPLIASKVIVADQN